MAIQHSNGRQLSRFFFLVFVFFFFTGLRVSPSFGWHRKGQHHFSSLNLHDTLGTPYGKMAACTAPCNKIWRVSGRSAGPCRIRATAARWASARWESTRSASTSPVRRPVAEKFAKQNQQTIKETVSWSDRCVGVVLAKVLYGGRGWHSLVREGKSFT